MDDSLMARLEKKLITPETAYLFAFQKNRFERFLRKGA